MENATQALLARITPRNLFQILDCYTRAWTKGITTPAISFSLHNGHELLGELIHVDFPTERLALRLAGEDDIHVAFVEFRHIQHFALYGLGQHADFISLL